MNGKKICFITAALFFLTIAVVLTYVIYEECIEEIVIDEWNPITPSLLYPRNVTGWAFKALTTNGTYLELNISASGIIRVIVGKPVEVLGKEVWENVLFNDTGQVFDQKIEVAGKDVDYLEIRNEGMNPVNISGCVKKTGNAAVKFYRYQGLGFFMGLLGTSVLIYGIFAKPQKKRARARRIRTIFV